MRIREAGVEFHLNLSSLVDDGIAMGHEREWINSVSEIIADSSETMVRVHCFLMVWFAYLNSRSFQVWWWEPGLTFPPFLFLWPMGRSTWLKEKPLTVSVLKESRPACSRSDRCSRTSELEEKGLSDFAVLTPGMFNANSMFIWQKHLVFLTINGNFLAASENVRNFWRRSSKSIYELIKQNNIKTSRYCHPKSHW